MMRDYSGPAWVTQDQLDQSRDYCEECDAPTDGTSLCGPCNAAHFGAQAIVSDLAWACPACWAPSLPLDTIGAYSWRQCSACESTWVAP